MRKPFSLIATLALCLTLTSFAAAQGKKPASCGDNVTLSVTLSDDVPNKVVSDGKGAYTNGGSKGDKITAILQVNNCSYDFTLNLNYSARFLVANFPDGLMLASKFFNFDRVASVPRTDAASPTYGLYCAVSGPVYNADGSIARSADGKVVYDNYAGCGVDPDGRRFVRRAAGFTLYEGPSRDYKLRFQSSPIDANDNSELAGTAYVKVYHESDTTWEIVPDKVQLHPNSVVGEWGARLKNSGGGYVIDAHHIMPFRITATKQ
jgi:hypothetical protein